MSRRIALGCALAAGLTALMAAAAPALGTEAGVVPGSPGAITHVDPLFRATVDQGVWKIAAPALAPADAGPKWRMGWSCLPGTEIASIEFGGLRYAEASRAGLEVTSAGRRLWSMQDAELPGSPNPGKAYSVPLPPGVCDAELTLYQGMTVNQGARTYWIGDPRVRLRDIAPPAGSFRAIPGGWVNAAATPVRVEWSAADNLGAAGIAGAALLVGDKQEWVGGPAVGDFAADLALIGVPDGHYPLKLRVDGNGTAPGEAVTAIHIDRTAPVVTGFTVIPLLQPGRIAASWSSSDAMSDVAGSYVQINEAPDGSTAGTWTSLTGTPGRGPQQEASIDATPAGQGLHAVRLVSYDGAGNPGVAVGPPVLVDTIAPELSLASLPDGLVGETRVAYTVDDDQRERSGLGPVEIAVNTATDGSETGDWQLVAAHAVGAGPTSEIVSLRGFASGRHRLRVRAHNAGFAGATLFAEQSGEVQVDSTTPTLANVQFQAAASHELTVSWIADDTGAGVAGAAVQALDRGQWSTVASGPAGAGPGRLGILADRLPAGIQRLRLIVVDAAGNGAIHMQNEVGSRVDPQPPTVADLRLASTPTVSWTQSDPGGGFGDCPTTVAVGLGGHDAWRTLVSLRLGEGAQSVALPLGDLAEGAYSVRVTACDEAGNQSSAEIGGLTVATRAGGAARPADDPERYRGARIEVRASGGAAGPAGTRVIDMGEGLVLAGRLRDRRNQPLPGTRIEAREARGRALGETLTDRAGAFRLRIRPAIGPVRVGVPVDARVLPARGALVRVTVRPRLTLTASTRVATSGGAPVEFRGRFDPSPERLGLRAGKRVDLHYRHPVSGEWQLVQTAGLAADGSFSIRWPFRSRGYTFPLRATVTGELGWPFAATRSGTVAVTVTAGP
jgi:hypothetical protein